MQEVITYLIIVAALIYTLYNFVKVFIPSKNKEGNFCSGGCSGCSLSKGNNLSKIEIKKLN